MKLFHFSEIIAKTNFEISNKDLLTQITMIYRITSMILYRFLIYP